MADVSPTKWHRAHVTWFFETFLLAEQEPDFAPFQDRYWFLFNSYYEAVGPRYARAQRGVITRPGRARRRRLPHATSTTACVTCSGPSTTARSTRLAATIELGFHHEQQHQELLLMDVKHVLSLNPLQPVYGGRPSADLRDRRPRLGRRRGRAGRRRPPRCRVLLRQRAAPAPHLARALPPRRPARHQRRVAGVHGRRRLPPRRPLALRRLGQGQRRGLGGPVLLVGAATAPGSSTPSTARGRSTPDSR